jgi:hypothetical protein
MSKESGGPSPEAIAAWDALTELERDEFKFMLSIHAKWCFSFDAGRESLRESLVRVGLEMVENGRIVKTAPHHPIRLVPIYALSPQPDEADRR